MKAFTIIGCSSRYAPKGKPFDTAHKPRDMKTGDVVTCKSHEHKMTVRSVEADKVTCDYFIPGDGTLYQETYGISELTIV